MRRPHGRAAHLSIVTFLETMDFDHFRFGRHRSRSS
jgi:hypothetical protein